MPQYIRLSNWKSQLTCVVFALVCCVVGEALNFLLLSIVSGFAVFIAFFGNGFIYGLSKKYFDMYIPQEHQYAATNFWCFIGDLGGYVGQSGVSIWLAHHVCMGRHYEYVCHQKSLVTEDIATQVQAVQ